MSGDSQMEWIPVDKALPEKEVLLLIRTLVHVTLGTFEDNFLDEEGDDIQCVTHWAYIYEPEGY
jgi:hypothetical protein